MLERVRSFVWIVLHEKLMTNERKSKMHLSMSLCAYCREEVETTQHVLRDYINVVPHSMSET